MTDAPDWLPGISALEKYQGDWRRYINQVYAIFKRDFISSQPRFRGKWVRCRRDPIFDGKEAGFWHCVSEGPQEEHRIPDLRRCERIGWIRGIIEHPNDANVAVWVRPSRGENRVHLWYREEYLIVLGQRKRYYQLITAFPTDRTHTIRKKRKERDLYKNG